MKHFVTSSLVLVSSAILTACSPSYPADPRHPLSALQTQQKQEQTVVHLVKTYISSGHPFYNLANQAASQQVPQSLYIGIPGKPLDSSGDSNDPGTYIPIAGEVKFEGQYQGYLVVHASYDDFLLSSDKNPQHIKFNQNLYVEENSHRQFTIAAVGEHEDESARDAQAVVDRLMNTFTSFDYRQPANWTKPLQYLTPQEQQIWKSSVIPSEKSTFIPRGLIGKPEKITTIYYGYLQNMYIFESLGICNETLTKDKNKKITENLHFFFGVVNQHGKYLISNLASHLSS